METRATLGERLRRARVDRGVGLADAAVALHVRVRHLQALETDDFSILPPSVYTRALIRNYARFLGVDPADVLEQPMPLRAQDRNPIRPAIQPLEKPPLISMRAIATFLAISLVAVLFVYLYVQYNSFAQSVDMRTGGAEPLGLPTPQNRSNISPLLTPAATLTPLPTSTAGPTTTPITGLLIEARVVERSWMQVWVDGRSVLAENLQPGSTRAFNADQSLRMRVGNAGGVDVTVNGVHQGRLGSPGQVLDANWGRE